MKTFFLSAFICVHLRPKSFFRVWASCLAISGIVEQVRMTEAEVTNNFAAVLEKLKRHFQMIPNLAVNQL